MKQIITSILIFLCLIVLGQNNKTLSITKKLIDKEEYLKAISLLNSVIDKDTSNSEGYTQRAICLIIKGEYEKALDDLKPR